MTLRDDFEQFHEANPQVAVELARLAFQWRARGYEKCSIAMLFEVLRWNRGIKTHGDDFKLNNNYRAFYARMLMARHRDLVGMFDVREQHYPTA